MLRTDIYHQSTVRNMKLFDALPRPVRDYINERGVGPQYIEMLYFRLSTFTEDQMMAAVKECVRRSQYTRKVRSMYKELTTSH